MKTRKLVFISHANPEDNEFTRWLGMHLVRHGYQVWSDITKLIGGEVWWNDIEEAIRDDTAKFLFVLSRASNGKPGTRNELHLALNVERQEGLRDFVVPVLVDSELPFSDINIQISNRNTIPCTNGWAQGLSRILEKLEEDSVPQDGETFAPATVTKWWRENVGGSDVLHAQPATIASNWFPLSQLPEQLRIFHLENRRWTDDAEGLPAHRIARYLVSFASADGLHLEGCKSDSVATKEAIACVASDIPVYPRDLRYAVIRLLRMAWHHMVSDLGMPTYQLANGSLVAYFTDDLLGQEKRIRFAIADIGSGQRALTGHFRGHRWHYGVSADVALEPEPSVVLRGHVLFSDDGTSLWDSKARLHRARRSACRDWWNDRWRDMMLAAMSWISRRQPESHDAVYLLLGENQDATVGVTPRLFQSPVTYSESDIAGELSDDSDWECVDDLGGDAEEKGDDEN